MRFFPGWLFALNHHPAFIHFPIVLWLLALLFEMLALWRRSDSIHRAAAWMLWLGTISGTFAVVTGLYAARLVPGGVGGVLEIHKRLMLASYFLAVALSIFALVSGPRRFGAKAILVGGLAVLSALVILGADRGAEMVGRYGFGVNGAMWREPASRSLKQTAGPATLRYVGSAKCGHCHQSIYSRWKQTPMANVVRDPRQHPDAILADFSGAPPFVNFTKDQVAFVYGSIWKQNYFTKVGNEYYPLNAKWDIAHHKWMPYLAGDDWWAPFYPPDNTKRPTGPTCNGCHSVNYNIQTKDVTEWNVGCEDCHGPGSAHVNHPTSSNIVNPANLGYVAGNNVCMQCHVQGRPAQYPTQGQYFDWPPEYYAAISRIGFAATLENLDEYWKLEPHKPGDANFYYFADGTAHKNRMQGNDFVQSLMYRHGVMCSDCHDVHGTQFPFELRKPADQICSVCHAPDSENGPYEASLQAHTHHKVGSAGSSCIACHMPQIETEGVPNSFVHAHTFGFISPALTLHLGVPNPCTSCHKDQTPQWALDHLRDWQNESPWRIAP